MFGKRAVFGVARTGLVFGKMASFSQHRTEAFINIGAYTNRT